MKICLFGGTFDPPHIGHLIIAETIKESERFDKMIFVPAFHPPHKDDSNLSSIEDRLEMLRLSVNHDDTFELSDIEIERGGISYTIETIRELKSRYDLTKRHIYFLMGSDALVQFHDWKDHVSILKECRHTTRLSVQQDFTGHHGANSVCQYASVRDFLIADKTQSQATADNPLHGFGSCLGVYPEEWALPVKDSSQMSVLPPPTVWTIDVISRTLLSESTTTVL